MSETPVHRTDRQRTQGETIILVVAAIVIGCAGIYMLHDLLAPAFFALTLVITLPSPICASGWPPSVLHIVIKSFISS